MHFSQSLMPLKTFIKIPMLKLMLQLYSRNFWMKSVRDIIPMMVPWPRQLATKLLPGSLWKRLLKSLKIRWNIWFMIFKCHEKWFAFFFIFFILYWHLLIFFLPKNRLMHSKICTIRMAPQWWTITDLLNPLMAELSKSQFRA